MQVDSHHVVSAVKTVSTDTLENNPQHRRDYRLVHGGKYVQFGYLKHKSIKRKAELNRSFVY